MPGKFQFLYLISQNLFWAVKIDSDVFPIYLQSTQHLLCALGKFCCRPLTEYMLKTYVPEPTSRSVDTEFSFFVSTCLVFLHNVFYRTCLFSSLLLLGCQQDLCLHHFMHLGEGLENRGVQ